MATFQVLNLRDSINKRDKSQSQKEAARNRQKSYLKDVLVQNFMKKFNSRLSPQNQVQNSLYITRIVSTEVELFLQSEQLTQKNLATFERRVEAMLSKDPKIQELLLSGEKQFQNVGLKERRNTSAFVDSIQHNQSSLQLPKIQASVTPTRNNQASISMYHQNRMNALRKSHVQQKQSFGPYGFQTGKAAHQQQSMQSLTLDKSQYNNGNPLLSTRVNHSSLVPLQSDRRNNDAAKSFADLRIKMGNKKRDELDDQSLPSDLDGDEWAEIVKYEQEKFEEEKKKEKDVFEQKRRLIKETLDRQLKERNQQRQKEIDERKAFEQNLLISIKEKEEIEKKKQDEMKNKIYEQKAMRDWQLEEAKAKKTDEYQRQREEEIRVAQKLKSEINEEKMSILNKKMKEREVCQKIISENEDYKVKQQGIKEQEKVKEQKALEEYNKMLELQDKKRQEEWAQREQRIQQSMNRMADTVVRKTNEQEKELERKVMKYQLEKEERDKIMEMKQQMKKRQTNEEIVRNLNLQIQEKKQQQQHEEVVKDDYMKKWISMTELDAKKRQDEQLSKKQQKMQLQDYLLMQMGEQKVNGVGSVVSGQRPNNKKQIIGGPMTAEELRMNKQLLQEISRKKKEKQGMSSTDQESTFYQQLKE